MRAGSVVEKEAASRVGAEADGGLGSFDYYFGCGTGEGGEQPIQAVFAGNILDAPGLILLQQFIVAFGDAKDGVHGFDPLAGDSFFSDHSGEYAMERFAEAVGFSEQGICRLGVAFGQEQEARAPLGGDNPRSLQEGNQFLPMKFARMGGSIDEVKGETSSQERIGRC